MPDLKILIGLFIHTGSYLKIAVLALVFLFTSVGFILYNVKVPLMTSMPKLHNQTLQSPETQSQTK